jgi:hypothetical protein
MKVGAKSSSITVRFLLFKTSSTYRRTRALFSADIDASFAARHPPLG